jgi:hypothetical protein
MSLFPIVLKVRDFLVQLSYFLLHRLATVISLSAVMTKVFVIILNSCKSAVPTITSTKHTDEWYAVWRLPHKFVLPPCC